MSASDHLNQDQFVDLYHGTRSSNVPGIKKEGLKPPSGTGPQWFMLTTSRDQAARYSPHEDSTVLHFRVPRDQIYGTPEHRNSNTDPALWNGWQHDVYGHEATAHAIRSVLPAKYLSR